MQIADVATSVKFADLDPTDDVRQESKTFNQFDLWAEIRYGTFQMNCKFLK